MNSSSLSFPSQEPKHFLPPPPPHHFPMKQTHLSPSTDLFSISPASRYNIPFTPYKSARSDAGLSIRAASVFRAYSGATVLTPSRAASPHTAVVITDPALFHTDPEYAHQILKQWWRWWWRGVGGGEGVRELSRYS